MSRSPPELRAAQRKRRKLRRIEARLCLHGLCCPLPLGPDVPGRAPHLFCPMHRTRKGRADGTERALPPFVQEAIDVYRAAPEDAQGPAREALESAIMAITK